MTRVFELAKKLDITAKQLISDLKNIGVSVKNHMSVIEEHHIQKILVQYKVQDEKKSKQTASSAAKGRTMILIKKERVPEKTETAAQEEIRLAEEAGSPHHGFEPAMAEAGANEEQAVPDEAAIQTAALREPLEFTQAYPLAEEVKKPEPPVIQTPPVVYPVKKQETEEPSRYMPEPRFKKEPVKPPVVPAPAPKQPQPVKVNLQDLKKKFGSERNAPDTTTDYKKVDKTKREKTVKTLEFEEVEYEPKFKKWFKGKKQNREAYREPEPEILSTIKRKKVVKFKEGLSVKDFGEIIGRKNTEVIRKLMDMGCMMTLNQPLDKDVAMILAEEFDVRLEVIDEVTETELMGIIEDAPEQLVERAPVVTIMGHVDHGKTSLLDAIRNSTVVSGEAGGITQHIGAYQVFHSGRPITFLDTPGHEAFTAMRARGANVTDIVLLLVAADDGVMPQTVEAINHAKAANATLIVVINKIDKPGANLERVKSQLMEYGLLTEELGGSTIFAEISAKKRIGLDHLLEMILLQADMLELKANPNRMANGTIIEAKLDKSLGAVATVLIQGGVLRAGDLFVVGRHEGKVRTLTNSMGERIAEAGPSTPVEVTGLQGVPMAGDPFFAVRDEKTVRSIMERRDLVWQKGKTTSNPKITLDNLFAQLKGSEQKELKIIIKADVHGSAEALKDSIAKLSTEKVAVKVIHSGVGGITETDVTLASASNAIIAGFNVKPDLQAKAMAESEGVDVRSYSVIYNLIDDIKKAMEGMLEPVYEEKVVGKAEVRSLFSASKVGSIAGCYVLDGVISRNVTGVRVKRDNVLVFESRLSSLRRFKDDVKEVHSGYECGILLESNNELQVGDILEAYNRVVVSAGSGL